MSATAWTREQVARIAHRPLPQAPLIDTAALERPVDGFDLWDFWPVQDVDGKMAAIGGGALWMALSAPAHGDPVERHGCARIRLLHHVGEHWHDLGPVLPDGFGPGSREWSGSAVLEGERVALFYTAAGRLGEPRPTFEQRLFQATARLVFENGAPRLADWSAPAQSVASDRDVYHPADQAEGAVGAIKAFRDPGYFRDPADGRGYLLFAASLGRSGSAFNGAVGLARAVGAGLSEWSLMPPVLQADALNNELERPHALVHGGFYYLFWSTQRSVFAPGAPSGPTGLYGMSARRLAGPYEPLNGDGLVVANPVSAPDQAYSWLVLGDLRVVSFVDDAPGAKRGFGGSLAPMLRLSLDGANARML